MAALKQNLRPKNRLFLSNVQAELKKNVGYKKSVHYFCSSSDIHVPTTTTTATTTSTNATTTTTTANATRPEITAEFIKTMREAIHRAYEIAVERRKESDIDFSVER